MTLINRYEGNGSQAPDGINPIVGVRAWRVQTTLQKEDLLHSVYKHGVPWPIDQTLEAQCIQPITTHWRAWGAQSTNEVPVESHPKEPIPYIECSCGIYALNSELGAGEVRPWGSESLVGIVLLWGRILEGERGYRAQYAKIAALWMDTDEPERVDLVTQVAERYHVPLITELVPELEAQRRRQRGG